MSDPLVLALLSDAPAVGAALAAGFEEEGVPLAMQTAAGAPVTLAREAARSSLLGLGIGADRHRLALVLAGATTGPYLEAAARDARSFAHNAARIAARRPLSLG